MAKRKTQRGSDQRHETPQVPAIEIDFEAMIAAAIVAAVMKPSKRWRKPRLQPRALGKTGE
jgi:hypothetical protein